MSDWTHVRVDLRTLRHGAATLNVPWLAPRPCPDPRIDRASPPTSSCTPRSCMAGTRTPSACSPSFASRPIGKEIPIRRIARTPRRGEREPRWSGDRSWTRCCRPARSPAAMRDCRPSWGPPAGCRRISTGWNPRGTGCAGRSGWHLKRNILL